MNLCRISNIIDQNHCRFHFRYVINELIETEQDYVKDLGGIVEVSITADKRGYPSQKHAYII